MQSALSRRLRTNGAATFELSLLAHAHPSGTRMDGARRPRAGAPDGSHRRAARRQRVHLRTRGDGGRCALDPEIERLRPEADHLREVRLRKRSAYLPAFTPRLTHP